MTESSFAEEASEEAVELEADCEWPARCTLRWFCPPFDAEPVRVSGFSVGVAWNAYGCTGAAWLLYAVLFDPLYMLLGAWPRRGDCC